MIAALTGDPINPLLSRGIFRPEYSLPGLDTIKPDDLILFLPFFSLLFLAIPRGYINWTARLNGRPSEQWHAHLGPVAQWLMDKSRRVMLISVQTLAGTHAPRLMNIHRAI